MPLILTILAAFVYLIQPAHAESDVFQDRTLENKPCPHCPLMVQIPKGQNIMGALPGTGQDDEKNAKGEPIVVRIKQGFAVSVGEVTRAQFNAFLRDNPGYQMAPVCAGVFDGEFAQKIEANWQAPGFEQNPHHPVVCVRWQDAVAYTEWLSRKTGNSYRLLSEAEWEYAARGGSPLSYWWGDQLAQKVANCAEDCQDRYQETAPVYSLLANPFGLYHMSGNVWEWTQDCYQSDAYNTHAKTYPYALEGPVDCRRVIRGGSWLEGAGALRHANREAWRADMPLNDIGFRVARDGVDQET